MNVSAEANTTDAICAALIDKYAEMIALRHERALGAAIDVGRARALALRFPGVLRELDRAPLAALEERLQTLVHARSGAALPAWAELTWTFHRWLSVAHAVRRAAGRDRDVVAAGATFSNLGLSLGMCPEDLNSLLFPPSGRLSSWVVSRLAPARGLGPEAAEEALFGHLLGGW